MANTPLSQDAQTLWQQGFRASTVFTTNADGPAYKDIVHSSRPPRNRAVAGECATTESRDVPRDRTE